MAAHPLADLMRSHGFDPDAGCMLVLPPSMHHLAGGLPPSFVCLSRVVTSPVLTRPPAPAVPQFTSRTYASWFAPSL